MATKNGKAKSAVPEKAKVEKSELKKKKAEKTAMKTNDPDFNFAPLDNDFDEIIHEIEKSIGISQMDVKANKVTTSTGLLALDLVTSGGLVTGGWYTIFGGEQSCKSTLCSTQMANAITSKIPHLLYFDYEGSFQAEYFLAIARHVGAIPAKMPDGEAHQRIFGLQNNDGKWVVPPRIRYYPMSIGEKFFDYVARLMRQLPDKLSKEGKWWLVYDPENKLHKDYIKTKKPEYNEKYYKRTGKWWVETEHGLPQALIITDSYPAMNPEKMDVDDPSAAMAMQARMFSDNIKRIKGKMSAKRITVLGINQLRLRPGVSFGCFHANTNILLADGTTKTIKNIVDNKLEVDVLSYNPQTKKVEAQPVTGWYNNGRATQDEWLSFKVKTIVEGKGPRFDLKVTKNHLLMDAKGYLRRAHTFEVGEKFLHVPNQQQLGETQRQLFLGSVLGDGWFIPGPADLNSCGLGIAHAKAQFQYLKWKYQILEDITVAKYRSDSGISTIETVKIGDPWFIDVYTESRLGVTGLRDYRVSPSLLSQISPLGLAVWAMDDASKERWQLKMQSYSIDDAQAIIDNLNSRFNLKMPFSVWTDNNSKTGKGWGTNLKRDFMDLISPYVHDTFSESFERNELGIYTGYSKERDGGFYSTTAVITAIAKDTVKLSDKYDIQVANNHLYVADGVVVENSPEYEPCGEALKFNSDVRIRMASRSVQGGSGQYEEEPSINGGVDQYRYIHMRAHKNKLSVPNLEGWARIWVKDSDGVAHGFDPVYDAFFFMKELGLISGTKNKLKISLKKFEGHKPISWLNFKKLILGSKKVITETLEIIGVKGYVNLRKELFDLFKDGKAMEIFFERKKSNLKDVEEDD